MDNIRTIKVKNAYIFGFSLCQMIEIEKKVVPLRSKSATYTKYVYLKGSYTL